MSSASSSTASSSLSRSKISILIISAVAVSAGIWYLNSTGADGSKRQTRATSGALRRRNAIHRRRRAAQAEEQAQRTADDDFEEGLLQPLQDGETLIGDDDGGHDIYREPGESAGEGEHLMQLLYRISEDNTRRNAYVHRGCICNSCGTLIRGIRYQCSNCVDFELCESCEAQGRHIRSHIFYKIRIPMMAFAPRNIQPVPYPGNPDSEDAMQTPSPELQNRLRSETGFDLTEIIAYWEQWTLMATEEWRDDPDGLRLVMDRKTFDQYLVPSSAGRYTPPNLIHNRMFAFYDTNKDNMISFPEYLNGLAFRKKKDKLKKVFEGYDINGDGFVDRKDFLRIFRSLYALDKQKQKDMLELEDQIVNNIEARRLVNSRQPLSSAFASLGGIPNGTRHHWHEGKMQADGGELEIIDGGGVISESSNDRIDRSTAVIERLFGDVHDLAVPASTTYWQGILNPPTTMDDLQHETIDRLLREIEETRMGVSRDSNRPGNLDGESDLPVDAQISRVSNNRSRHSDPSETSPLTPAQRVDIIESSAQEQFGAAILAPVAATLELHDRWKRRLFYTDEEDGVTRPLGYSETDDLDTQLRHSDGSIEDGEEKDEPESHPQFSPRSRSSSKVRFAADVDFDDTKSNASLSSRSVPERWDGLEIPEAERDSGKEILYQVTQQAFNELLDQLFKEHEDRAVFAMSNKEARQKHRHLFTNEFFEKWVRDVTKISVSIATGNPDQASEPENGKSPEESEPADGLAWEDRPIIPEVELNEVRQRALPELLAATGYTVSAAERADDAFDETREYIDDTRSQVDEEVIKSVSDSEIVEAISGPQAQGISVSSTHESIWQNRPVDETAEETVVPPNSARRSIAEEIMHRVREQAVPTGMNPDELVAAVDAMDVHNGDKGGDMMESLREYVARVREEAITIGSDSEAAKEMIRDAEALVQAYSAVYAEGPRWINIQQLLPGPTPPLEESLSSWEYSNIERSSSSNHSISSTPSERDVEADTERSLQSPSFTSNSDHEASRFPNDLVHASSYPQSPTDALGTTPTSRQTAHDPTFPQFRPNSEASLHAQSQNGPQNPQDRNVISAVQRVSQSGETQRTVQQAPDSGVAPSNPPVPAWSVNYNGEAPSPLTPDQMATPILLDDTSRATPPPIPLADQSGALPQNERVPAANDEEKVKKHQEALLEQFRSAAKSLRSRLCTISTQDCEELRRAYLSMMQTEYDNTTATPDSFLVSKVSKEEIEAFKTLDWYWLLELRDGDLCYKQAIERKGWGRLNFNEFQTTVHFLEQGWTSLGGKRHEKLPDGNDKGNMDYLGSWIEFCIP